MENGRTYAIEYANETQSIISAAFEAQKKNNCMLSEKQFSRAIWKMANSCSSYEEYTNFCNSMTQKLVIENNFWDQVENANMELFDEHNWEGYFAAMNATYSAIGEMNITDIPNAANAFDSAETFVKFCKEICDNLEARGIKPHGFPAGRPTQRSW